jgi:hypothetical protein
MAIRRAFGELERLLGIFLQEFWKGVSLAIYRAAQDVGGKA